MNREGESADRFVVYVGTGKLVGLIGTVGEGGISRIKQHKSIRDPEGFHSGLVTNLEQAARTLQGLMDDVLAGHDLEDFESYVVLGNPKLKSYSYSSSHYYQGLQRCISPYEIRSVISQTRSVATLPLSEIVLQAIPESFLVNDMDGIQNPIGLEAQRLGVNLKIFTMNYRDFKNVQKVFEVVDLEPYGFFSKMLTVSEAVLSEQEKSEGALVIDIAEDVTHFTLWKNGYLAETLALEMGGAFLTEKIAAKWEIQNHDARKVKEHYATFELEKHFSDEIIPLVERNGEGRHQVRRQDFHESFGDISKEWIEEILSSGREFAKTHHVMYPHCVFTGGGTRIDGFLEFLQKEFSQNARIGLSRKVEAPNELLVDPSLTAPLGMFRWLATYGMEQQKLFAPRGFVERTLSSARHWFSSYF